MSSLSFLTGRLLGLLDAASGDAPADDAATWAELREFRAELEKSLGSQDDVPLEFPALIMLAPRLDALGLRAEGDGRDLICRTMVDVARFYLRRGRLEEAEGWARRACAVSSRSVTAMADVDSAHVLFEVTCRRADSAEMSACAQRLSVATSRRLAELHRDDPEALIRVGDLAGAQLAVARSQHAYPRCEAVTDVLVITAFRLCAALGSRDPYALAATVTAAVAQFELARDEGSPERMEHAARRLKILSDDLEFWASQRREDHQATRLAATLALAAATAEVEVARALGAKIRLTTATLALRALLLGLEQRFGPRSPFGLEARANFAIAWLDHARAQRREDLLTEARDCLAELSQELLKYLGERHPLPKTVNEARGLADRILNGLRRRSRELPQAPIPQVAINDLGTTEDLLAAIDETFKYFEDGDIVEGTVVHVDYDEVLLDIGHKTEGIIPARELSIRNNVDPHEVVSVGDHIEALVLQKEDKEGRLILSKKRAQFERAWGMIEKIKGQDGGFVTGVVIEVVRGGLILDIGLRGFMPASLVSMQRVGDLHVYLGKELEAKIIELDKNRNNVVLSRRAWLEEMQSEERQSFLTSLLKGQVRSGVVSSIVNFGVFVDLGGIEGLVHISELSWKHVNHPAEVVDVGHEVTVEVLDVDMARERVSLSIKATQEDPWQQFARTHPIGQIVPGRVAKLVPFGAFVRLDDGIEGLVHISELAERHVKGPEQVVAAGDEVFVKIVDFDLRRRRISLSIKQADAGLTGDPTVDQFDATRYGMPASFDAEGEFIYPDGFDAEAGEWLEGHEAEREAWEARYAAAQQLYERHQRRVSEAAKGVSEAEVGAESDGE